VVGGVYGTVNPESPATPVGIRDPLVGKFKVSFPYI